MSTVLNEANKALDTADKLIDMQSELIESLQRQIAMFKVSERQSGEIIDATNTYVKLLQDRLVIMGDTMSFN